MVHIAFVGTARSGLGHLRRISTIAQHLRPRAAQARLTLITNAPPAGLSEADRAPFGAIEICPRAGMAERLAGSSVDLAVLDTLRLPGIGAYSGPCVLILRETPDALLDGFRRDDGRPWTRVLLPNPDTHWHPDPGAGFADAIDAVGWILRPTGPRAAQAPSQGIVLATGGGGTPETRAALYPLLDEVVARARVRAARPFRLRQALGPRADAASLAQADETFDPGPHLNELFRDADLVISTAGYNSVLELATTDTPALLAAIPRSLDDQAARVRAWGPRLGHGLDPAGIETAAAWLADRIDRPRRRPPLDPGPDGAARAADLILEALCPTS